MGTPETSQPTVPSTPAAPGMGTLAASFWASSLLAYGFGVGAKLVNVEFGYDVYAHIGGIAPQFKYAVNNTAGAMALGFLVQGIADEKIIPRLGAAFKNAVDHREKIGVGLTMAGLTILEVLQSLVPKAKFDWEDMAAYALSLAITYNVLKRDAQQVRELQQQERIAQDSALPKQDIA